MSHAEQNLACFPNVRYVVDRSHLNMLTSSASRAGGATAVVINCLR